MGQLPGPRGAPAGGGLTREPGTGCGLAELESQLVSNSEERCIYWLVFRITWLGNQGQPFSFPEVCSLQVTRELEWSCHTVPSSHTAGGWLSIPQDLMVHRQSNTIFQSDDETQTTCSCPLLVTCYQRSYLPYASYQVARHLCLPENTRQPQDLPATHPEGALRVLTSE